MTTPPPGTGDPAGTTIEERAGTTMLDRSHQPQPEPSHGRREPEPAMARRLWQTMGIILAALALFASGVAVGVIGDDNPAAGAASPDTAAPTTTVTPTTTVVDEPLGAVDTETPADAPIAADPLYDASAVGNIVIPSVVTVQVGQAAANGAVQPLGSGSGVVYDASSGYIVTNDHVVETGSSYEVIMSDGRVYPAELVGSDPVTDLAVLQVAAGALTEIEIGSTEDLSVGQPAIAVGSPLGLVGGPSLTVGVLSAFGREVQTGADSILYGMLQTDAPITQGSSGGALVDRNGALIGITTAVGVSSVGIEGVGFATPIEIVSRVVDELIADGTASEPFLGITGRTEFTTMGDGGQRPVGVGVESVQPGSAAGDAGFRAGDQLTSVDGLSIDTMDELIGSLRRFRAGETIEIDIIRDSSPQTVTVTLGDR